MKLPSCAFTEKTDFCLGINKVDVWDLRFNRKPFTPHKKVLQLIQKKDWKTLNNKIYQKEMEPYIKDPFPTPKPCGILRIKGVLSNNKTKYEERLSLADGLLKAGGSSFSLSTFVDAYSNLLVLKCQSKKQIVMEFIRKDFKRLRFNPIEFDLEQPAQILNKTGKSEPQEMRILFLLDSIILY